MDTAAPYNVSFASTEELTDSSFDLAPRQRFWRIVSTVFIVFHLVGIVFWNMTPSYVQAPIQQFYRPYMTFMGLYQSWGMFAPEPGRDNYFLGARITYRDGRRRLWYIGRQDHNNNWQRILNERARKMAEGLYNPNIGRNHYPQMSLWAARKNNIYPNNPPVKVEIMRFWASIPLPPYGVNEPISKEWKQDIVYSTPIQIEAKR
jgi:hypothetical protein